MSIALKDCFRAHSKAAGNVRFLLYVLADRTSDDLGYAYPSQTTLTRDLGLASTRSLRRIVHAAVEIGELRVEPGRGRGHVTRYFVLCGAPAVHLRDATEKGSRRTSFRGAEKGSERDEKGSERDEKGSGLRSKASTRGLERFREDLRSSSNQVQERLLGDLPKAYWQLTGKQLDDDEHRWLDDLCKQFGRVVVGNAMYDDPTPREPNLVMRVSQSLRGRRPAR